MSEENAVPDEFAAREARRRGPCPAMNPDGTVRCHYSAGHDRLIGNDGDVYDHAAPSLGVWWNAPDAVDVEHETADEDADELREIQRRNGRCDTVQRFGEMVWGCVKVAGHPGECIGSDGRGLVRPEPEPAAHDPLKILPPSDGDAIHELIAQALRDNRVRIVAGMPNCSHGRTPSAVRVRFVDLPTRHREAPGPFGFPGIIAEPGGFALVVDRFGTVERCENERAAWERFGEAIGARTVFCYPGELDVVTWIAE